MDSRDLIQNNLTDIESRISAACVRGGRNRDSVRLVAVCKKQPVELIQAYIEAAASSGQLPILAENYVQDLKAHRSGLRGEFVRHLIGPLQSNKVREAVSSFDLIESVQSAKIARLINSESERLGKVTAVLIQVNVSEDPAKSGFREPELRSFLSDALPGLKFLDFRGLMTITRFYENPEMARPDFRALSEIAQSLGRGKLELSMGMSDDFEIAIEEGATMVRIGSALFGERA